MTDKKPEQEWVCENGCRPTSDTPFYYPPQCTDEELGVLAYADGEPSNRWIDGVIGIPLDVVDRLDGHDWGCLACVGMSWESGTEDLSKGVVRR